MSRGKTGCCRRVLLLNEQVADRKTVNSGGLEGAQCVRWARDHRFATQIERGIEQYGNPGKPFEFVQYTVEMRILFLGHGLHSACAVNVHDGLGVVRSKSFVCEEHMRTLAHAERLKVLAV